MSIYKSLAPPLQPVPDNLSVAQFILDTQHPLRPSRALTGAPWLVDDETGVAFGLEEIRARTYGLANGIAAQWGVGDGDVVCIFSSNHIDYGTAIWAVHRLGATVSAANPSYTASELAYQLEASNSSLILTHPGSLPVALEAAKTVGIPPERIVLFSPPPRSKPTAATPKNFSTFETVIAHGLSTPPTFAEKVYSAGEGRTRLAFLSFSSGTTGKPKAVAISHYAVIANVLQVSTVCRLNDPSVPLAEQRFRPGDVATGVLPFFHIYGLVVNLHTVLFAGATLVVFPKFNYTEFLRSIVRRKITHLFLVPPQVVLFCKHPATKGVDLSHVWFCMMGAAPLSAELSTQFKKIVPNSGVLQGYGMTETTATISMAAMYPRDGVPGSTGRLISGTEAKVVRADGSLAKHGEPGELVVRGPQNALCYLNDEKATKETFVDGWVHTGDEVIIREDGELFIVDRLKEILKVKGFQVAPGELEGHLFDHEHVADAGVVGISDEFSGELPLAFVVLHPAARAKVEKDPQALHEMKASIYKHVSDSKVRYKWLDGGIHFIDAIPKNPSGKILRRVLRDKAKGLQAISPMDKPKPTL